MKRKNKARYRRQRRLRSICLCLLLIILYEPQNVYYGVKTTIEKTELQRNFQELHKINVKEMIKIMNTEIQKVEEQELLLKKQIEEKRKKPRISADSPGEEYYYHLEDWEKDELAKLVCAEAGGEPYIGKVAVAAVVLNRLYSNHPDFEKYCLESIIFQKGEFASIEGITYTDLINNPDCIKAVEDACKGWDPTREIFPETGALYFYEPNLVSERRLLEREGVETMKIGNHNFHVEMNKIE